MNYAFRIGFRYLRSKKRFTVSLITVIAISAVALGVGALLSVLSITGGFQDAFRDKVLGVNAHVLVLKYGLDFEEYRDVMDRIDEMPEVAGSAPFIIHEMMLTKGDRVSGVLVKGVDPERMPKVLDLPGQMTDGSLRGLRRDGALPHRTAQTNDSLVPAGEDLDRFLTDLVDDESSRVDPGPQPPGLSALPRVDVPTPEQVDDWLGDLEEGEGLPDDELERGLFLAEEASPKTGPASPVAGLVVGKTLASTLDIEVGDRVRVVSPLTGLDASLWSPQGRTPRSREFEVIGIFEAGFQEYDSRLAYVDLYEAQAIANHGDTVTGVEVRLRDLEQAPQLARKLQHELGGGPFHTMDWRELNHNLFTALEIQKIVLSVVFTTIIVVAAFFVIATLIMIVLEKKREIAILKAMGAKDSGILGVFFVQGSIIGLVGTGIGLLLGGGLVSYLETYRFPLDPKVYLIDHLPIRVSPVEFVLTVGIALVICACATLVPSWWAARLLPADGVRYE